MRAWVSSTGRLAAMLLALVLLAADPSRAVVTLPGGDTLLDGGFDEVSYGASGLAWVSPLLFVGDLGTTKDPQSHALLTNLTYGYAVAGLGTPMMSITYTVLNEDPVAFSDLRFMLTVQADGSNSFLDAAQVLWGVAAAGDPDAFQVSDFSAPGGDLKSAAILNGMLDGSDACGAPPCDVDFGLQWSLASLGSRQRWTITVGLSDDGSALSDRLLRAQSVDTEDTELTLSGVAMVIPEPRSGVLVLAGLGILLAARRARRTGALDR